MKKNEKQIRKSIAIPASLWKKIERLAKKEDRSTSKYIRMILLEHLQSS